MFTFIMGTNFSFKLLRVLLEKDMGKKFKEKGENSLKLKNI